ncbi:MAG: hypothetical protein WCT07_04090 [Candidatus Paceibacterota bacterium]
MGEVKNDNLFKKSNKWVMIIPFIDSLLIRAVELPKARYVGNSSPCVAFSDLIVDVSEPQDNSVYGLALQQLKEGTYVDIECIFIDDAGINVESWKMKGRVSFVDSHRVSYTGADTLATSVSFNVQSVEIDNHHNRK